LTETPRHPPRAANRCREEDFSGKGKDFFSRENHFSGKAEEKIGRAEDFFSLFFLPLGKAEDFSGKAKQNFSRGKVRFIPTHAQTGAPL